MIVISLCKYGGIEGIPGGLPIYINVHLGAHAHIETRTPNLYLDIHLEPGATFTQPVPETYNGFVYVWRGEGNYTFFQIKMVTEILFG